MSFCQHVVFLVEAAPSFCQHVRFWFESAINRTMTKWRLICPPPSIIGHSSELRVGRVFPELGLFFAVLLCFCVLYYTLLYVMSYVALLLYSVM